jgi:hypothetical protein
MLRPEPGEGPLRLPVLALRSSSLHGKYFEVYGIRISIFCFPIRMFALPNLTSHVSSAAFAQAPAQSRFRFAHPIFTRLHFKRGA